VLVCRLDSQYVDPQSAAENNERLQSLREDNGRSDLGHGESAQHEEAAAAGRKPVGESSSHQQQPGVSDPSADSSSPRHKRPNDDSAAGSQGYIPIKKRLKAAAVQRAAADAVKLEAPPEPDKAAAEDATPLALSKRDPLRNRRKPDRSTTPLDAGPLPLTPAPINECVPGPETVEADDAAKKQRGRPPKPGQTPGVTLRPRPTAEQVDTPALAAPPAVIHPTPTTNPTPPSGFVPRVTRRMSIGQKSPSPALEPSSTEIPAKPDPVVFKAAALSVLRQLQQSMTAKDLTQEALQRGLGCPVGRVRPPPSSTVSP